MSAAHPARGISSTRGANVAHSAPYQKGACTVFIPLRAERAVEGAMQLSSPVFPGTPNSHTTISRPLPKISIKPFSPFPIKSPSCLADGASLPLPLQEQPDSDSDAEERRFDEGSVLKVRRPTKEPWELPFGSLVDGREDETESSLKIDRSLSEFAKKMPIFEPERVSVAPEDRPLGINLELGLHRAKTLTRNFEFKEADEILRKCILFWPEDGRAYVALGKLLSKQSKFAEARLVYERGCQATQGENPYIWQCWAVLENKVGNVRRARELFDAATVADKKHVAAWHGWAVLEIKQGNINRARNLLGKGLKHCGGNEYIYQTLALLEAKGNRFDQARQFIRQATECNPKSCASWLAWAQLEMQQENNRLARQLFEKAVQASPKNRFAWHVWALFEVGQGDIQKGRKLLKIGRALNPRDPVLLQSLALLEYKHSSANVARTLFRRASELDPRHQPVWMAWGWMEWKEGNINTARELYQRSLSIDSTNENAARCLQAWGVLEQRLGNLSAARRLFRSSLNINSQSYITWMTWASFEEEQGNPIRAEEIRNTYFQQRTEVVDDASWVMGFLDIIDPALDSIKRVLKLNQTSDKKSEDSLGSVEDAYSSTSEASSSSSIESVDAVSKESDHNIDIESVDAASKESDHNIDIPENDFDVDAFVKEKLSLDTSRFDGLLDPYEPRKIKATRKVWRAKHKAILPP